MSRAEFIEYAQLTYLYEKQKDEKYTWNRAQKEVASWKEYATSRAKRKGKKLVNVRELAYLTRVEREALYPSNEYECYYE